MDLWVLIAVYFSDDLKSVAVLTQESSDHRSLQQN